MKRRVEYLRAHLPLVDATIAAFSMRSCDYSVNWRHNYIVALTTLRATGHVLHKVDTVLYPEIKELVGEKYQRWKKGEGDDALFKYFIEDERNQLLKAYQFTTNDGLAFWDEEFDSGKIEDIDVIDKGFFKGCDVVAIIDHSVGWWRAELSEIAGKITEKSIEKD